MCFFYFIIVQFTVLVSAPLLELITKEVAFVIDADGTERMPCVPPGVLHVT